MKISAQIPSVTEVEIEITPNVTIAKLKKKMCAKLNIEPDLTNLLLDGKPLKEHWKVSKLKLESKKLEIDYFWSRQMILWGEKGQTKLRNSRVLIAGAGPIGNEIIKNLAMLGVGKFAIVDYDIVEVSNLSRMLFFNKTDSGKSKSTVLAEKLGDGRLTKYGVRFVAQVWPGDSLTARAVVDAIRSENGVAVADLTVVTVNQDGKEVVSGYACARLDP